MSKVLWVHREHAVGRGWGVLSRESTAAKSLLWLHSEYTTTSTPTDTPPDNKKICEYTAVSTPLEHIAVRAPLEHTAVSTYTALRVHNECLVHWKYTVRTKPTHH